MKQRHKLNVQLICIFLGAVNFLVGTIMKGGEHSLTNGTIWLAASVIIECIPPIKQQTDKP